MSLDGYTNLNLIEECCYIRTTGDNGKCSTDIPVNVSNKCSCEI